MANVLNSIEEAVDGKYLVVKDRRNQAKKGTLVHIMSVKENGGRYTVGYRVTDTKQDFTDYFDSVKEFSDWVKPDTFIARYYECFDMSEILKYIKINQRTFLTFCLPIIGIALLVIWILFAAIIKGVGAIIAAVVLSILAIGGVIFFYKHSKTQIKMDLYKKISAAKWGVQIR